MIFLLCCFIYTFESESYLVIFGLVENDKVPNSILGFKTQIVDVGQKAASYIGRSGTRNSGTL